MQVTYGIQKKETDFSKLPPIKKDVQGDSEYGKIFKSIIYINTNKMPGPKTSKDSDIQQKFFVWKPILKEQIELYDFDIVIFGGTYKFYEHDFSDIFKVKPPSSSKIEKFKNKACHGAFVDKDNKLYIDAYHPSYWTVKDEAYFNGIIEIVKKWEKKKMK